MKILVTVIGVGILVWWFVKPGSSLGSSIGGFFGDIIAYIQFLVGAPLIGGG